MEGLLVCAVAFLIVWGFIWLIIWSSKERSKMRLVEAGYTPAAAKELVDKTYRKAFWNLDYRRYGYMRTLESHVTVVCLIWRFLLDKYGLHAWGHTEENPVLMNTDEIISGMLTPPYNNAGGHGKGWASPNTIRAMISNLAQHGYLYKVDIHGNYLSDTRMRGYWYICNSAHGNFDMYSDDENLYWLLRKEEARWLADHSVEQERQAA